MMVEVIEDFKLEPGDMVTAETNGNTIGSLAFVKYMTHQGKPGALFRLESSERETTEEVLVWINASFLSLVQVRKRRK